MCDDAVDGEGAEVIKAVIFDCFGVFYVDPGLYFYSKNVPHYDEVKDRIMELDRAFDRGFVTMREHDEAVAELTGLAYEQVHEQVRKPLARNEEMLEYTQVLRHEYKIGLLSNVGKGGMFERFFTKEEQKEWFDEVQLSYKAGYIKPEREAFELIAQSLGVAPHECVMVDDREVNCRAAESTGMQAVQYNDFRQFKQDLEKLL